MNPPTFSPYILGLDIGANSIGWALVKTEKDKPVCLLRAGVRVFPAGVEGDFESGRAESRAVPRRQARLMRRQLDRRARRRQRLLHQLQQAGLLPPGEARDVIPKLDRKLDAKHRGALPKKSKGNLRLAHTLPYHLRALALKERLEPYEIGRAIYHLAQRRGYETNRRRPPEEGEEKGQVEPAIAQLKRDMAQAGARTLGEYLAGLDPTQQRIRGRWTSRQMHKDEFEVIWSAQAQYHPNLLTPSLKKRLYDTIFFQRPLRSAKGLVGPCEFERNCRRAPMALPLAQRFRLVQQLVNTRIVEPDGKQRPLTRQEWGVLLERLERGGDLTFTEAKKLLGLSRRHKFGFEEGGERRFVGNRTNACLGEIFGNRWWTFSDQEREQIIQDLRSIQNRDVLARRGRNVWGLDPEAAERFADLQLDSGYANLSRRAMVKLLPYLEDGVPYATAVKEVYGEFHRRQGPFDRLPPVDQVLPHLRNPAVHRALTELRKVVNNILREFGKPEAVRVELARDMRRSKEERQRISRRNRQRERLRQEAAEKLLKEMGIQVPRPRDIEKVLLAEECNWTCPYTGRSISMRALFGDSPEFDVEHIIPFSRCLDNSFFNKTLCEVAENRNRKGNRTPAEAYAGDPERWQAILDRVRRFKGDKVLVQAKLRRFQMTAEDLQAVDFVAQQLSDTRYASRQALQYLGLLYGGLWDEGGKRRVQAVRGTVTGYLRAAWFLNAILGENGRKARTDHRHHAIDAVVVALADPATIKALADAAQRPREGGGYLFGRIEEPWPNFTAEVRRVVEEIRVSHRPRRQVSGPLHRDTLYSPEKIDADGRRWVHYRKPLDDLSQNEVEAIVDPAVRALVKKRLQECGLPPDKAFSDPKNHPCLYSKKKGAPIPIHRVRIRKAVATVPVGEGPRLRHVETSGNYHIEVFEVTDRKNRKKWVGRLVTRLEALRRLRRHQPLTDKTCPEHPGARFVFTLAPGDTIELDTEDGGRALFVVRSVSQEARGSIRVEYVDVKDARQKADIKKAGDWHSPALDTLRKRNARKVVVTPLGRVRRAND